jgi:acyl-CoA dehydrogenase
MRMIEAVARDARMREALRPLHEERGKLWAQMARGELATPIWSALARAGAFSAILQEAPVAGSPQAGSLAGLAGAAAAMCALGEAGYLVLFPALTIAGSACIERYGAATLRREVLPEVAAGARRICFGVTEARAGFNVLEIDATARAEGDGYLLSGEKSYVSGFDVAHEMLFLARTRPLAEIREAGLPRTAGISLFLVPTRAAGIEAESLPVHGETMVRPHRVSLRDVGVSRERLVGEPGQGFTALAAGFNLERILLASVMLGAAHYCLARATEHAKSRQVFDDRPIGSYQAIQHPLAEVRIHLEALDLLVDKAVDAFSRGAPLREVEFLANASKYLASEVGLTAVDSAIQTLGGRGFDERSGIIQMWDAMRLLKLSPISNELILNRVAEQMLSLPRA